MIWMLKKQHGLEMMSNALVVSKMIKSSHWPHVNVKMHAEFTKFYIFDCFYVAKK